MADNVLYDLADGVATITLNRADAMNALDTDTKVALRDAVLRAAEDPEVRAVVLTGTGRAFCVGQDLKQHIELLEVSPEVTFSTVKDHYNPLVTALATMPKPVIAAVNGVAAGAGAAIAFACDFRVVSEKAGFNLAFAGVALTADSGASWTLPRLVGHARATEMLMFPETIPAAKALELGLATRVVPAEEVAAAAGELARRLAAGPTVAYGAIKESLAYAADHSIVEALAKEDELQLRAGQSADHRIAVDAFLAKAKPEFTGK
ncbi:enoyl-CoA hydratase-related protein [Yinghuangia soli]|uniref:Enoyl-CoA hydratase-related protein n=1 Tax=Yinghuangia soli TaxID=2908204 RepID=A0AA41Q801_9ACTN|nr:enoyl-CoA hydratase-related protein [Yinghuangia soli]MCF2532927.1 enoyl-CoA hydratase-related protein [Yinghuangia soli]